MKTILITGAAGDVGTHLRRELAGRYRLVVSDRKPIADLREGETFVRGDVTSFDDMLAATKGAQAVIHLGAVSTEGDWPMVRDINIDGTYNVFEAAKRNGARRIIFATSNHAVGFYERTETIDHAVYPRPDSRYGVSKVFGEALGSLYADKYGMEMFMMRIGNVGHRPLDKRRLSIWFSPRDLAQLVSIGIDKPGIKFEIVYGISNNKRRWYDNANAERLGYRPQDDSETFAQEILAVEKPATDPIAEAHQGGIFCSAEDVPNPAAPQKKAKKAKKKKK